MKSDVQLSRRTFLAGVTALASGFVAAGCGGGNSGSGNNSVTLHQVNTGNAQALANDIAASAATGAITPTLKQVYQAVQSNLSTSQMDALVSAGQQFGSPETTAAWVKQYWDASKREFVLPQDIQDAITIAQKVFPSLPYSGGLVTVETAPARSLSKAQAASRGATANSRSMSRRAPASATRSSSGSGATLTSRSPGVTPTLLVLNPSNANEASETSEAITVSATGTGFVQGTTTVELSGVVSMSIPATVLSSTQLTFVLPAEALTLAGSINAAVSNGPNLASEAIRFNVLPGPVATCDLHTEVMIACQYSVTEQCSNGSSCGEGVYYYAQYALESCCTLIISQGSCISISIDNLIRTICYVVIAIAIINLCQELVVVWHQDWDNCKGFYCPPAISGTVGSGG